MSGKQWFLNWVTGPNSQYTESRDGYFGSRQIGHANLCGAGYFPKQEQFNYPMGVFKKSSGPLDDSKKWVEEQFEAHLREVGFVPQSELAAAKEATDDWKAAARLISEAFVGNLQDQEAGKDGDIDLDYGDAVADAVLKCEEADLLEFDEKERENEASRTAFEPELPKGSPYISQEDTITPDMLREGEAK